MSTPAGWLVCGILLIVPWGICGEARADLIKLKGGGEIRGELQRKRGRPAEDGPLANDRNDRIYLATPQGLIIALHERGREFPAYYKYPERQPILPEFAPEDEAADAPAGEMPAEKTGAAEEAAP
jgi:hypothetical protein